MSTEINYLPTAAPPPFIPPLENGDHLTRAEFERRYEAMPPKIKAELIEGVVYMASPVRVKGHGKPHAHIIAVLCTYCLATPGVEIGDNITVRLDLDNEPQPDVALWISEDCGGRAIVTGDDYLEGAPELIVEVAASTVAYDLHEKKRVYRRNGVGEYLVWRAYDRAFDWFSLQNGEYVRLAPDDAGLIHSRVFPGLRLNVGALLQGDAARAVADLQAGLHDTQHASFAAQLAARKKT
jgi:Uma2 family endonuclease